MHARRVPAVAQLRLAHSLQLTGETSGEVIQVFSFEGDLVLKYYGLGLELRPALAERSEEELRKLMNGK